MNCGMTKQHKAHWYFSAKNVANTFCSGEGGSEMVEIPKEVLQALYDLWNFEWNEKAEYDSASEELSKYNLVPIVDSIKEGELCEKIETYQKLIEERLA